MSIFSIYPLRLLILTDPFTSKILLDNPVHTIEHYGKVLLGPSPSINYSVSLSVAFSFSDQDSHHAPDCSTFPILTDDRLVVSQQSHNLITLILYPFGCVHLEWAGFKGSHPYPLDFSFCYALVTAPTPSKAH